MSRILDSMHLFCCLQYICNVEFIQFKCILHVYNSTQTDPHWNVECNPIVLHIVWYTAIPPPFRTNVPFREHVIYEWMNIVCIVYILSVMNLHPSSLRAITVVCIFMDGIENIQHFTWMAYLNYTIVMWNSNAAVQFYMAVPMHHTQHFSNALMYAEIEWLIQNSLTI